MIAMQYAALSVLKQAAFLQGFVLHTVIIITPFL
jgi:hypothetical protein